MPTIATIDGIKIKVYANDHNPPHCHAEFAEDEALIDVQTFEILQGNLPKNKLKKALAYITENCADLLIIFQVRKK